MINTSDLSQAFSKPIGFFGILTLACHRGRAAAIAEHHTRIFKIDISD